MTFIVERVTPGQIADHSSEGAGRTMRMRLPFEVEVEDIPEIRKDYETPCRCKSVYRITEDSREQLKRRGMLLMRLQTGKAPCVCLCMGRII